MKQIMTANLNKTVDIEPEEEYRALLRSLSWTDGFGLFFVRCSPEKGERIIEQICQDIPYKKIQFLRLQEPIDSLYRTIESLPNREDIDILFITGLEHSLYDYEEKKFKDSNEQYLYSWQGVPRVLGHLNLQRERFRNQFKIAFVFLLPLFAIKYFIRRAPDFFDWRSGVFDFPTDRLQIDTESSRILADGDYQEYCYYSLPQRRRKIKEIEELIHELHQNQENRAKLWLKVGNIYFAGEEYEEAIASYNESLKLNSNSYEAWYNRGVALGSLNRWQEEIESYNQVLQVKPDFHQAYYNRGIALGQFGRYEEAIESYDRALKINPEKYQAWESRGFALSKLGRYVEAIASYDRAIDIKEDYPEVWYNRGLALYRLGEYQETIYSWQKVIELDSKYAAAFYNLACLYAALGDVNFALDNLQKAINLNSQYQEKANRDPDFSKLKENLQFHTILDQDFQD